MTLKKNHLWAVGVLIALFATYYATKLENTERAEENYAAQVEHCQRETERDAYQANGFLVLSRRVGGGQETRSNRSALEYEAAAVSVAAAMSRPKGLSNFMKLIEVDLIEAPNGDLRYALTKEAKELQEKGCRQLFSP